MSSSSLSAASVQLAGVEVDVPASNSCGAEAFQAPVQQ